MSIKQIPFTQNLKADYLYASILKFGKRIIADGSGENTTTTLYQVPSGKIFLLLSMNIRSKCNTAGTPATPRITISGTTVLATYAPENVDEAINTLVCPLSMPLWLQQGETIACVSERAGLAVGGCVIGYEMDANIIEKLNF